MRLLVIEDDPDLNRQLATALTDAGYVVDRAFDGEEGHYLGETEPYDAVILDIGLPKMDGISVLESWRRGRPRHAGADADRARPLERQGPGLRRRRRRLRRQALPSRRGAGAHPGAAAPLRRPRQERAQLRAGPARHPHRAHRGRRQSGQADLPRIPAAVLSDAPRRPRGLPHRTGRASLRPGFRPRQQHHRGVRRPHPQEARRRHHPDRARARLSAARRRTHDRIARTHHAR